MVDVFTWVGFFLLTGLALLAGVGVWWGAITVTLTCMKETHWIAAWVCYKRGNTEQAKRTLRLAVRGDEERDGSGKGGV